MDASNYGYRKITYHLRKNYDLIINHKKVYRLCKELNICKLSNKIGFFPILFDNLHFSLFYFSKNVTSIKVIPKANPKALENDFNKSKFEGLKK